MFTSFVRFAIKLPECLLSTSSVSALIREANISVCISFLTSSETFIIITFARYKERPFVAKAMTISPGIKYMYVCFCSIKSCLIAGSNK